MTLALYVAEPWDRNWITLQFWDKADGAELPPLVDLFDEDVT